MTKIEVFCIITFLNIWFVFAVIENQKSSGHNLFHGLKEEPGKSSRLENTAPQGKRGNFHGEHTQEIVETLGTSLGSSNNNNLLNNFDASIIKSSLYLQPEPRGLQYMLNVGDYNPFLVHYIGKRDLRWEVVGEPHEKDRTKCAFCTLKNKRQIPLEPGNIIPGSRGQSILLGVPHGAVPGNIDLTKPFPRGPFQPDINQGGYMGGYKTFGY